VRQALVKLISDSGSRSAAARRLGVHRSFITELMAGTRQPGPRTLKKLGFRRVTKTLVERIAE